MPQVYALEVASGAVVFLPEDGKDLPLPGSRDDRSVYDRTRAGEFACLVAGCGPFSHVAGGHTRRHSWVHPPRPAGLHPGHDPESMWHQQVKHHFAKWIRDQLGPHQAARIVVDETFLETPLGKCKPDILVELANKQRIAVEIQRSAGDPPTLKKRRAAYAAVGVVDWWIYSDFAETCRLDRNRPGRVSLIRSQMQMTEQGQRFYWFNMTTNEIATPYMAYRREYRQLPGEDWTGIAAEPMQRWRPVRRPRHVYLGVSKLDSCQIVDGALVTPVDRQIEANERRYAQREPERRAAARERHRQASLAQAAEPSPNPEPPQQSVDESRQPPEDTQSAPHVSEAETAVLATAPVAEPMSAPTLPPRLHGAGVQRQSPIWRRLRRWLLRR